MREYRQRLLTLGRQPVTINRKLATLGSRANRRGRSAHVLRHTFAKYLVVAGVGLERVAALLGCANLNTTRIYTAPGQRDPERAVDLLA